MIANIVRQIDEDIARLETQRADIDRQLERFRKARANLIADADPHAPRATVEPLGGPFVRTTKGKGTPHVPDLAAQYLPEEKGDPRTFRKARSKRNSAKKSAKARQSRASLDRPLPTGSKHAHMRERVLHAMQVSGAETHSEIMAALGLETPHRYEVANALRDLRDAGLIERTGQTGEPISGRGRAPERHRVVAQAAGANTPVHRGGNGVRRSGVA